VAPRAKAIGMDRPAVLAALAGLLVAPMLGYLATLRPNLLASGMVAAAGFTVVLMNPRLWLPVLMAGGLFDEVFVPTGFAKLGMGDLAFFAVLPAFVLRRFVDPRPIELPRGWGFLFGFIGLAFASTVMGVNPTYGYTARVVSYQVALVLAYNLARDEDTLRDLLVVVAICAVAHGIIALSLPWHSRLEGLAQQPNMLSVRLALGIISVIGLLGRSPPRPVRAALLAAMGLLLTCMLLTNSRGSLIALSVSLLWLLRHRKGLALAFVVSAAAVVMLVPRNEDRDTQEMMSKRLRFEDKSVDHRTGVLRDSLKVIQERPLFGVGFGQYQELDRALDIAKGGGRSAHNFYLGTAASAGVPALLMLMFFAGITVRRLWRRARQTEQAALAGDAEAAARRWLLAIVQAMLLYHAVSLMVRDAARIVEWMLLGLYAAASTLGPPAVEKLSEARARRAAAEPSARPLAG
jgi:O-antigen ligase